MVLWTCLPGCLETPLTQTTLFCTHPWCHWRQPNRSSASLGPLLVIARHRARRIESRSRCCEPSRCAPPIISNPGEAQEAPDPLMRSWDGGKWGMTSMEGVKWHQWSRDRCVLGRSCSRDRGPDTLTVTRRYSDTWVLRYWILRPYYISRILNLVHFQMCTSVICLYQSFHMTSAISIFKHASC